MSSINELDKLHTSLTDLLTKILDEGVTVTDDDGKPTKVTPSASYLNTIRQFLKDNGIECAGDKNPDVKGLADKLPYDHSGSGTSVHYQQ